MAAELLGRPIQPVYGEAAKRLVHGRVVLVTGAAGSIGSELVRQLLTLEAGAVFMLDQDESGLHALQLEIDGNGLLVDERYILCDIRNPEAMLRIFESVRPEIVFHAAANKHLPLLERSPDEGIRANISGTDAVASACVKYGTIRFVNISTDKAAAPTSVLGMTKRLAERIVAGHAASASGFASVRFGNVLGSRGSLLPTLHFQLSRGMKVSLTDLAVTRYFMTIPEAAGLVIEAAVMADRGETYVLDMGEPVLIAEMITRFVSMLGVSTPKIEVTGLRPGEKLHEELAAGYEECQPTEHPRISVVIPEGADDTLKREVQNICALAALGTSPVELRSRLEAIVSGGVRPFLSSRRLD